MKLMGSQILQFLVKIGLKTARGKGLGLKKLISNTNAPNCPILLCIVGKLAGEGPWLLLLALGGFL